MLHFEKEKDANSLKDSSNTENQALAAHKIYTFPDHRTFECKTKLEHVSRKIGHNAMYRSEELPNLVKFTTEQQQKLQVFG